MAAPRQANAEIREIVVTFRGGVKEELQILKVRVVGDVRQHDRVVSVDTCLDLSQIDSLRLVEAPTLSVALVNGRLVGGDSPCRSVSAAATEPSGVLTKAEE